MSLVLHVLSGGGADTLALDPHPAGVDDPIHPWEEDGQTAHPNEDCAAIAYSNGGSRCRKEGVVELLVQGPADAFPHYARVCGGHWLAHSRGKVLELVA